MYAMFFFNVFFVTAQSWEKQIINGQKKSQLKKFITNITKYSNFNSSAAMSYQGYKMQKKHWMMLNKESILEKLCKYVTKW